MLSDKTFLVTGATGRLGCETVARLEQLGAEVLPIVLKGYPDKPRRVKWAAHRDPIIVNTTADLKGLEAPDHVINFHWLLDRTLPFSGQLLYELSHSVHQLSFFWDWLKDVPCHRFVNISSTKVFSHLNGPSVSSGTEPRPVSPYGITKLAAEKFLDAHFHASGFPVVHLYLCSVAASGGHHTQIMGRLFRSCYENEHMEINARHTMNIMYMDEIIDMIINAALAANQGRYILASPPTSVGEIASKFEEISGRKLNATYVNSNPGEADPAFESDHELLRADWIRHTSLESMINEIISQNLLPYTVTAASGA